MRTSRAAHRRRAEPEALPGREGLGAASCPVRAPRSPPEGARAALSRVRVRTHLAGDRGIGEPDPERPVTAAPTTGGFFQQPAGYREPVSKVADAVVRCLCPRTTF